MITENRLQATLARVDFCRFMSKRYLIMKISTKVTNTSPIMAKTVQLWKIFGSTNRKIGNVTEDATIQVKIIFQFFISSFGKKSLQRKNNTIVSNIIVISNDSMN